MDDLSVSMDALYRYIGKLYVAASEISTRAVQDKGKKSEWQQQEKLLQNVVRQQKAEIDRIMEELNSFKTPPKTPQIQMPPQSEFLSEDVEPTIP